MLVLVLLDLSTAFDTIDHDHMLRSLDAGSGIARPQHCIRYDRPQPYVAFTGCWFWYCSTLALHSIRSTTTICCVHWMLVLVLLDLSTAFDTIDHDHMLRSLDAGSGIARPQHCIRYDRPRPYVAFTGCWFWYCSTSALHSIRSTTTFFLQN